jgi:hypothetical protein
MSKLANAPALPLEKKRILLIGTYATRRDLRARILRKLGVEVDCAADVSEARTLWRADAYNLVLMDVRNEPHNVEEFCFEVRSAKPPQRVAHLVGKPEYLAATPGSGEGTDDDGGHAPWGEVVRTLFATACEGLPRRWGFQEASWRIAATRSLRDPRSGQNPARRSSWSWADAVKQHTRPAKALPSIEPVYEEMS